MSDVFSGLQFPLPKAVTMFCVVFGLCDTGFVS